MGAEEFLSYLEDVEKIKGKEDRDNIIISLKTSDEMKEYSKEQTTEALSYDSTKNVLCNNKVCYNQKHCQTSLLLMKIKKQSNKHLF
jgi:hypothetical protein